MALVDLDHIRVMASTMLANLRNGGPQATAQLKPRPTDIANVFTADVVEKAIVHYGTIWAQPIGIVTKPEQTELVLNLATSQELRSAPTFPGGYKDVAPHLLPNRVWIAWKYVTPEERFGMAFDGVVWVDDHFAWFPKPWRMLAKTTDPFYVD